MNAEKILDKIIAAGSCNDISIENQIVANHEIGTTAFQTMLTEFYGMTIPAALVKTTLEIEAIYYGKSCLMHKIRIDADANNINDNLDIVFSIVSINAALLHAVSSNHQLFADNEHELFAFAKMFHEHYSIPLFKGLVRQYPNSTYHFYKGKCATCKKPSVIFKVIDSNNVVKYCGDFSGIEP